MIDSKTLLAYFMLENPKANNLRKVKDWMFSDKQEKSLFKVLNVAGPTEKGDLIKLRELAGCDASFIVDIHGIKEDIRYTHNPVLEKDIEEFVMNKYKGLISRYTKEGKINKVQKVLEMLNEGDTVSPVSDFLAYQEETCRAAESGMLGFSTGIPSLDLTTYGLIPGQIWVCGGYYGYGKTYFMLNLVESVIKQGKRVLMFSLEMSRNEILTRLMCLTSEIGLLDFFKQLDPEREKRKSEAGNFWLEAISTGQLIIDDEMRTSEDLVAKIATTRGTDFVCVDYIQLLSTGKDQYEGLREAMKMIQMVTKRYKVVTLLLSQISNQSQREGYNASVDGFKGAGDIGQVANVAMRIRRERDEASGEWDDTYGLHITKIRHAMPANLALSIKFPGGRIYKKPIMDTFGDGVVDTFRGM